MATTKWTGSVSGDVNEAGNWSNGVPGNLDEVIVPADATRDMDAGLTALLDTITSWVVEPGCKIKIGASGSPLQVSITTLAYYGQGELWFKDDGGTSSDVIIAASNKDVIVHIDGDTATRVHALRGNITLDANIGTVTDVVVDWITNPESDVTLTAEANTNAITRLAQYGGKVFSSMDITDLFMCGPSQLTLKSDKEITRGRIGRGATLFHNSTDTATGLGTVYVANMGLLDLRQGAGIREIGTLWRYPGSRVYRSSLGAAVTITNDNEIGDQL